MNFSDLTNVTSWVRAIDPDAEFIICNHALWIIFCGDADSICDQVDSFCCIDLMINDAWIEWESASEQQKTSAKKFRYIVLVG